MVSEQATHEVFRTVVKPAAHDLVASLVCFGCIQRLKGACNPSKEQQGDVIVITGERADTAGCGLVPFARRVQYFLDPAEE